MQKELIQDVMVSLNDGIKHNIITGRFQEQLKSLLNSLFQEQIPSPAGPALWLLTNCFISLSLGFLIHKIRIMKLLHGC